MDAVCVQDVTFRYLPSGKKNILDHVSISIPEDGITVLTGASGCGKSTLAAVMAGLYPEHTGVLETGSVTLFGRALSAMNGQERAGLISMMFQNPDLQFCMDTLRKELLFCLENICVPPEQMEKRLLGAVDTLQMGSYLDRKLHTLSGGEKQKAALCCLLALDSRMIVLDEAFANIDTKSAMQIIAFLRKLADGGKTILAIDHRPELWHHAADRFLVMDEERAVVQELPKTKRAGEAAIVLKDFSVCRQTTLLENANAVFPRGCMTAVLGESGSGKTTMFTALMKQHPYAGCVEIDGCDLKKIKARKLFSKLGVVFQNPGNQFVTQNVLEEVRTGLRLWKKQSDEQALLEHWGLWQYRNYSPYMLSQGQQRRLAVLSVLAGGQEILLLDEPTYGQDEYSTQIMMEQLWRRTRQGLSVVFITHDEPLARKWADKTYRLEGKRLHEVL